MAKEILDCMYFNMNAYVWWYLRQPGCNIMNSGGTLKKKGYAMAHFSKFVRPGYYRIDATPYSPSVGVILVAFKGLYQDVIVAINQSTTTKLQKFTFVNDTIPGVTKYVTTSVKNINNEGVINCSNNTFSDNLEPKSINTYVTNKLYTAINAPQTKELKIFPNPVFDYLQLSTIENVTGFSVFNLLGQEVFTQTNPLSASLDLSSLKSGFYIIKFRLNQSEKCFRFLKK
jgi:hypothetical protein